MIDLDKLFEAWIELEDSESNEGRDEGWTVVDKEKFDSFGELIRQLIKLNEY